MSGRLTFELKKLRFRGVVAQLSLTSYGEEEPEFEPATLCSPTFSGPALPGPCFPSPAQATVAQPLCPSSVTCVE